MEAELKSQAGNGCFAVKPVPPSVPLKQTYATNSQ
jgi:hypothetical protein